jgi:hypothetical protein
MKACETCAAHRVDIGKNHENMPVWQRAVGMVLVYLPIFTLPFVVISAYLTYYQLKLLGTENLKPSSDYIPNRASHRYTLKNQITMHPTFVGSLSQYKWFWIANCTWYCPYSVALFEWHSHSTKQVKNSLIFVLPLLMLPFILISAYLTYYHLVFVGAKNVKTWNDYITDDLSRYRALFVWHAYLVKLVENWWCPFGHEKKETYHNAAIDKSFWHIYPVDEAKLVPEDHDNPIWNEDFANKESTD